MAENKDLENIITPVITQELNRLLTESNYDLNKKNWLINSFRKGFEIGYEGDRKVKITAPNLSLKGIGTKTDLWNKVMKEVRLKRFAGPFKDIPFEFCIQSPIGLVPKDGGKDTRLIFHLSYPRLKNKISKPISVNANTPEYKCTVKYPDFALAVQKCLEKGRNCFAAKSDFKSAFRNLGMRKEDWCLLLMKAENPLDGRTYYFVDKCLPFGGSISCAHFQAVSDAIEHIFRYQTGESAVNYLDDFFFAETRATECNHLMQQFLDICKTINFPVSPEKTVNATREIIFLGIMINTSIQKVFIPIEKIEKAKILIRNLLQNKRKTTVGNIQRICRLLNFFSKCIIPARAFTRRLYSKTAGFNLKPNYHINIDAEMKLDLNVWLKFLESQHIYARPFIDFDNQTLIQTEADFYTDSSGKIGCGGYCGKSWFSAVWPDYILEKEPSIEFLELYAVTAGILLWLHRFKNERIFIFCDNMSVVHMINSASSSCKRCMVLIRIITLQGMINNVRVSAKHVPGALNVISDHLSRRNFKALRDNEQFSKFEFMAEKMPELIWPMNKIWTD